MPKRLFLFVLLFIFLRSGGQPLSTIQCKEDFDFFLTTIQQNYAYWDKKKTDWNRVRSMYTPAVDTVTSKRNFVLLLEKVLYELYDHHASLNTNTAESQRLVPSGTDIWAEFIGDKPVITALRQGFGAQKSGLQPGMELLLFNDETITKAILPFLPKALKAPDPEAKNFALRLLLAGSHSGKRKITVRKGKEQVDFYPDATGQLLENYPYRDPIESKLLRGTTAYIRFNNRLGDNSLIAQFDSVLLRYSKTRSLILDLRETPGGGNTTVARALMGCFITKEAFYQKHEWPLE